MAEEEETVTSSLEEEEEEEDDEEDKTHDLRSLLSSEDRDFLVRNNGDKVKISELEGKTVGLYFSGSWCGPCRRFTPILAEVYTELASRDSNFEIVFVSSDGDDEDFNDYFCEMPWLAIPFSDEDMRDSLSNVFFVEGIPTLVIIDKNGKVLTDEAVEVVRDYGAEGYPFTTEKIKKLKEEEEVARMNQTIKSLLVTNTRDYLFTSNFKKVPVSDLEGKIVGLYFSLSSFEGCAGFTRKLVNIYNDLKGKGENFEIVLVSLEEDESSFMDDFEDMPWLGIPFKDKLKEKLVRYFELEDLPTLVVIGADGKTVNVNAVELVEDYGVESYPFTSKKLKELKKKEKARIENQTLESLLISGEQDFVIKNDGSKVSVSDLVGKNILLYFSAHWCPPCRAFLPHLVEVYNHIKERDDAFEIIFISSDEDEESFDDYFSKMPWLALPFSDERQRFLTRAFKISGIPSCVAINRKGKTVTKEARSLIMEHGADAYPFTKEAIIQLKAEMEEKAKHWPEKIRHKEHSHVLWKSRREYICDGCGKRGRGWSFYCKKCDFDLDPHCALNVDHEEVDSEDEEEEAKWPKKIKHMLHKHALVKAWRHYQCDACGVIKQGWSYFCEECDFDLHPECALGNQATVKVIDDSDDESEEEEVEDEDDDDDAEDDYIDNHGNKNGNKMRSGDDDNLVKVEDEYESLYSDFKQELQLGDVTDGDEKEEKGSKIENGDDNKDEDEKEGEEEDDNIVKVEDEHESFHSDLKQELQLGDVTDGEEKEQKGSKIENGDDNKDEDEKEEGEEEDADIVKVEDEHESFHSDLKQELQLGDVTDGDEKEEKGSKIENGDDNKDEDEKEGEEDYDDIVKAEDEPESLHSDFKQELQLGDVTDGDEKEEKGSKRENGDDNKDEDEEEEGEEDDNEKDGEEDDEEDDDDDDGPSMRGYVCNTRDRESSVSFQESLFTCKLYK